MAAGTPLNDDDRLGWLKSLNLLAKKEVRDHSHVIACSALKESYRQQLMSSIEDQCLWFVLEGSFESIRDRVSKRKEHYMPSSLLQSQFDLLEVPSYGTRINIQESPEEIVDSIVDSIKQKKTSLGVVGLGVMGSSLARNLARHGFGLSLYNQFVQNLEERVAEKLIETHSELRNAKGFEDLQQFVGSLETPRIILCMIPAGKPMDQLIENLDPLLSPNDILLDCGNSHFKDTEQRQMQLAKKGVNYLGVGVSGGEEGALSGPSIMVGGSEEGYDHIKKFLERIAAKDKSGNPCCARVGSKGAGHFVKMVHNGIEYSEMQLLAEVYGILRWANQFSPDDIANVFESWMETDVNSYLLEISKDILRKREGDNWLIDLISDKAENKGTGAWTTVAAAELGVPIPTIAEALFARYTSAFKNLRRQLNDDLNVPVEPLRFSTDDLLKAYRLARISNHHQGFHLIAIASEKHGWGIELSTLARIWTNGCIIRSTFMEDLEKSLKQGGNIFMDLSIQTIVKRDRGTAQAIVGDAIKFNIPIPALSSALVYLQSLSRGESYGNLIQAQRDYFGAHGYQRIDDPLNQKIHTKWKD
jgi:6-phosphogluconate dehydrogenase